VYFLCTLYVDIKQGYYFVLTERFNLGFLRPIKVGVDLAVLDKLVLLDFHFERLVVNEMIVDAVNFTDSRWARCV